MVWSEEDQEHVGLVDEFPSLSWLAANQVEALTGVGEVVAEALDDLGDDAPIPLSQRKYSGKFLVRTTPRVHRRLAEQAARTGKSLNAVANELLDV
ncbi:type II toxin-antitoxin system HicB family antitoxin [Gordonia sp. HY002]|uniref:type II toxin-antitoxin system HicB family antitoxin n=1 Tax=Gordonia zhenghanii TaxID=2911516 RepID=UPI001EF08DC0|nr:toxin-antitoxin system HicB family antitoxin [Gordonia zhenghanii]MCF8570465.1 type II toxin-antitoxin system HicB family antitoxin [Gordonia zhenghanii]MCF8602578.1 type II toxin-antitoxin system HicB family antitoxin [Gordonia zhenghanii]